jgi:hypothetical protein
VSLVDFDLIISKGLLIDLGSLALNILEDSLFGDNDLTIGLAFGFGC